MKNRMTIVVSGIVIVVILAVVFFISNNDKTQVKKEENKIIYNKSPGITNDKEVNGILFSNIYCKMQDGVSIVGYTVTNNNDFEVNIGEYEVVFFDESGNIIETAVTDIPISVGAKSSISSESTFSVNLEKAKKMELKLKEW